MAEVFTGREMHCMERPAEILADDKPCFEREWEEKHFPVKGNHHTHTHTFEMSIIPLKYQGPEVLLILCFH